MRVKNPITPQPPLVNTGSGRDVTIRELGDHVRDATGFRGRIEWDSSKPDGTPRKLPDIGRMKALGWAPRISIEMGLRNTYHDFLKRFRRDQGPQPWLRRWRVFLHPFSELGLYGRLVPRLPSREPRLELHEPVAIFRPGPRDLYFRVGRG